MDYKELEKTFKYPLPQWMTETLPNVIPEPIKIFVKDNKVKTSLNPISSYSSVEEAFDFLRTQDVDIVFDQSVDGVDGEFFIKDDTTTFICSPAGDGLNSRLLMGWPLIQKINDLADTYSQWLDEIVPDYLDNANVFIKAYNFVNNHPAFWLKSSGVATWETEYGCGQVAVNAYEREGKVNVLLETGLHIAPDYKTRYLDTDIVSFADTFEDAYILLASKVYEHYNLDGTSKR